jgi:4-amino-4-deoxy-L-arabinose transferase-like glycosyltransferase
LNVTSLLVIFGIAATGRPGPLRLIGPQLGGQMSWLLLFAIFGLIVVWRWKRPRQPLTPYQQGLLLWGTWFLTLLLFFSFALFDHPYYMVTFSPALCALVGIGSVGMYRAYSSQAGWRSWLLPLALFTTALVQGAILVAFPTWNHLLAPVIIGLSLLIALLLVIARLAPRFPRATLARPFVTVGLLVLLIAPTIWAMLPLWVGTDTINPVAGPPQAVTILTIIAHAFLPESAHVQPELKHYLLEHQGRARYLVATLNAPTAAPFILDTGKSAMALGGYQGFDQIVSVRQIASLVQQGTVRFFLVPTFAELQLNNVSPSTLQTIKGILQPAHLYGASIMQPEISHWVTTHCSLVPRNIAEPGTAGTNDTVSLGEGYTIPTQLFDCASAAH